jgi:hypothetical protein
MKRTYVLFCGSVMLLAALWGYARCDLQAGSKPTQAQPKPKPLAVYDALKIAVEDLHRRYPIKEIGD